MLEIEVKVRVGDLSPIRSRIQASGAALIDEGIEYDSYFTGAGRDFAITDEALRVRQGNDYVLLTYKGSKVGSGSFKAREELNLRVESAEILEAIFNRIGFHKTASVRKYRESYRIGHAVVTLDQVEELGTFAEIEAAHELSMEEAEREIERIAREFGIFGERLTESYLELLLQKQR